MKKMKLNLQDLSVESFATAAGLDGPGTVNAHEVSEVGACSAGVGACTGDGSCGSLCTAMNCPYISYEFWSCVATDCANGSHDACYPSVNVCATVNCGTQNTNCGQDTCAGPAGTCPY